MDNDHNQIVRLNYRLQLDRCKEFGLKIKPLEEDETLQDLVLTVHHAYMHTFAKSLAIKVTENHLGNAVISNTSGLQQN
ncbi:MAG: hypothetical protein CSA81_10685 [Acidobacteria bacterium]|nr:MAG: hypothetical protein CSA81_10685 [Acidobacteriota bacterium]